MAIQSIITALLCASLALGRNLPPPSEVVHTRLHITDLPPMDMNRTRWAVPGPEAFNATKHRDADDDTPALDKRLVFTQDWQYGVSECIAPISGGNPISSDCLRICEYIAGYHSPYTIGPLDIEKIHIGFCVFEMANLEPCEHITFNALSQIGNVCMSMYTNCAVNGYDGFTQGKPPHLAFTLAGLPAAPPYQQYPC